MTDVTRERLEAIIREETGFGHFAKALSIKIFAELSPPAVVTEIPDECCASGVSCHYAPDGPNGEMQCKYCGKEKAVATNAEPIGVIAINNTGSMEFSYFSPGSEFYCRKNISHTAPIYLFDHPPKATQSQAVRDALLALYTEVKNSNDEGVEHWGQEPLFEQEVNAIRALIEQSPPAQGGE